MKLQSEGEAYSVVARILGAHAVGAVGYRPAEVYGAAVAVIPDQPRTGAPHEAPGTPAARMTTVVKHQAAAGVPRRREFAGNLLFPAKQDGGAQSDRLAVQIMVVIVRHGIAKGAGKREPAIDRQGAGFMRRLENVDIISIYVTIIEEARVKILELEFYPVLVKRSGLFIFCRLFLRLGCRRRLGSIRILGGIGCRRKRKDAEDATQHGKIYQFLVLKQSEQINQLFSLKFGIRKNAGILQVQVKS